MPDSDRPTLEDVVLDHLCTLPPDERAADIDALAQSLPRLAAELRGDLDSHEHEDDGENVDGVLVDAAGEVRVVLSDGWSLRSGVYEPNSPDFLSGEYVRLCRPDGSEYCYWDQDEWATDPALVMGAILNAAAGLRFADEEDEDDE